MNHQSQQHTVMEQYKSTSCQHYTAVKEMLEAQDWSLQQKMKWDHAIKTLSFNMHITIIMVRYMLLTNRVELYFTLKKF